MSDIKNLNPACIKVLPDARWVQIFDFTHSYIVLGFKRFVNERAAQA